MSKPLVMAVTAALVATLVAAPASAGPTDPGFRTERVYFHCAGTTKLGNVSLAAENKIPSWNTTAPAGSVQAGNGCSTADGNGVLVVVEPQENPSDGVWRGTFTGNLDSLTVEVYNLLGVGSARVDDAGTLGVRLAIDGEAITGDGTASHDVTAVQTNSGATQRYDFSVTDIGFVEPNPDTNGDGIGDNPFGSQQHTITLTVDGYDAGTNTFGNWVYDSTEVPAGITFNPTTLAQTVIPRG